MLHNGTVAEVVELPGCDFGCGETARYDAQTKMGPWAFMCQSCFDVNGPGRLGIGIGQKLQLLEDEHLAEVIGHA